MTQVDYKKMSESEKKKEDWMNSKWRPAMGWIYMVTCSCDFIIFPVLWSILQSLTGTNITQWNPITLQGAGLYHLAMGAVLGVAAWSRGQEKMAGVAGGTPLTSSMSTSPGTGVGMNNTLSGMSTGMGLNNNFQQTTTSPPPPPNQPIRTSPPRQITGKSTRVLADNDFDDPDHKPKIDPEARS